MVVASKGISEPSSRPIGPSAGQSRPISDAPLPSFRSGTSNQTRAPSSSHSTERHPASVATAAIGMVSLCRAGTRLLAAGPRTERSPLLWSGGSRYSSPGRNAWRSLPGASHTKAGANTSAEFRSTAIEVCNRSAPGSPAREYRSAHAQFAPSRVRKRATVSTASLPALTSGLAVTGVHSARSPASTPSQGRGHPCATNRPPARSDAPPKASRETRSSAPPRLNPASLGDGTGAWTLGQAGSTSAWRARTRTLVSTSSPLPPGGSSRRRNPGPVRAGSARARRNGTFSFSPKAVEAASDGGWRSLNQKIWKRPPTLQRPSSSSQIAVAASRISGVAKYGSWLDHSALRPPGPAGESRTSCISLHPPSDSRSISGGAARSAPKAEQARTR